MKGSIRGLALALALLAPGFDAASTAEQQSAFRGGVELIAVDVQVIDDEGRPVLGISPANFEVTIDGRRRRIVSVDLMAESAATAGARDRRSPSGPVATNIWPEAIRGDGRTFILAIDVSSLDAAGMLAVSRAAREFIEALEPADRLGVFPIPFGPRVPPTTNRLIVRQALDGVSGQRAAVQGQFNLSTSEIIDISAETAGQGVSSRMSALVASTAGRGGAPAPIATDTDTLQRVQVRECRRVSDLGCLESIVSEASALAQHLEERAIQGLIGITGLLDALGPGSGRKTVVVLSGGMAVSDRPGGRVNVGDEARELGERAAHANAVVYAIHVDRAMTEIYSAQSRRGRDAVSPARERAMASKLLGEFADASGGTLLTSSVGSGEAAFERILRETSAYYLLGVEPTEADRDGKVHRLRVKVGARDVTVRSRQWVVLRRARP